MTNVNPFLRIIVPCAAAFTLLMSASTSLAQETSGTPEATAGILGDAVDVASCTGDAPDGTATTFMLTSEESAARYRAQEELRGIGDNEAVGQTSAVIGAIYLDDAGMPLPCSRVDVDLRTLQSDEARRDNYLYDNVLETEAFPLATFIVTGVEGLDGGLVEGEEATFQLIGNLTVHGVTHLVAWNITATRDGDTLTGAASTTFDMTGFDIDPPVIGPVVSLDETITLELDVTANEGTAA